MAKLGWAKPSGNFYILQFYLRILEPRFCFTINLTKLASSWKKSKFTCLVDARKYTF